MTKKELTSQIEIAMVRGNVAYVTSDVKVLTINNWVNDSFRMIDIAIIKYGLTNLIVRIVEEKQTGRFHLHNVYNVDGYLTSHKLQCVDDAIVELNNWVAE